MAGEPTEKDRAEAERIFDKWLAPFLPRIEVVNDIAAALADARKAGREEAAGYRTALASLILWDGDPDCEDGSRGRWRLADTAERKDALFTADRMAAAAIRALPDTGGEGEG